MTQKIGSRFRSLTSHNPNQTLHSDCARCTPWINDREAAASGWIFHELEEMKTTEFVWGYQDNIFCFVTEARRVPTHWLFCIRAPALASKTSADLLVKLLFYRLYNSFSVMWALGKLCPFFMTLLYPQASAPAAALGTSRAWQKLAS